MKEKLLALLLVLSMLVSVMPSAFAADSPVAAIGSTTYETFAKAKLNYVSLGDSMTNGYGLPGYELNSGVEDYGEDAYPNQFANWLVENVSAVNHAQLAMSGMRAEDLHWLLELDYTNSALIDLIDASYTGDWTDEKEAAWNAAFTTGDYWTVEEICDHSRLVNSYNKIVEKDSSYATNGTSRADKVAMVAKYYQDKVETADIISLGMGNGNFGVFLFGRIMGELGFYGADGRDAYLYKIENAIREMDPSMQREVLALKNELYAAIEGKIGTDSALKPLVDIVVYTGLSYALNYAGSVEAILQLNPDAEIILVGLMNTFLDEDAAGLDLSGLMNGQMPTDLTLGDLLELTYKPLNAYIAALPTYMQATGNSVYENATFYYAEAGKVECMVEVYGEMIEDSNSEVRSRFLESIVGTASEPGMVWEMIGPMVSGMVSGANLVEITLQEVVAYEKMTDAEKVAYAADTKTMNKAISCAMYLAFEEACVGAADAEVSLASILGIGESLNDPALFAPVMEDFKAKVSSNSEYAYAAAEFVASGIEQMLISNAPTVSAVSAEGTQTSAVNYVRNGSFEDNDYFYSNNWEHAEPVTGVAYKGNKSLKVTAADGADGKFIAEAASNMIPGRVYEISMMVKGDPVAISAQLQYFRSGTGSGVRNGEETVELGTVGSKDTWQKLSYIAVQPSGTGGATGGTQMWFTCTGNGTFWVDDIQFTEVPALTYGANYMEKCADYTADSWTAMQTALTAANAALTDAESQEAIDAAAKALNEAVNNLKPRAVTAEDVLAIYAATDKTAAATDLLRTLIGGNSVTTELVTQVVAAVSTIDPLCMVLALPEVLPESLETSPALYGLLGLFSRCIIGNGLGAHPSPDGHDTLSAAVIAAYENGYTAEDATKDNIEEYARKAIWLLTEYYDEIYAIAYDKLDEQGYVAASVAALEYAKAQIAAIDVDALELSDAMKAELKEEAALAIEAIEALQNLLLTADELDEDTMKAAQALLDDLTDALENMNDILAVAGTDLESVVREELGKLDAAVRAQISEAIEHAEAALENLKKYIDEDLSPAVRAEIEKLIKTIEDQLAYLQAVVEGTVEATIQDINNAIAALEQAVTDLIKAAQTEADQLLQAMLDELKALAQATVAEFQTAIYDATHISLNIYDDQYYVSLGGATANGAGVGRTDPIYSDLLVDALEAEGMDVTSVDLTKADLAYDGLVDYVKANAAEIAKATLITYNMDASGFLMSLFGNDPDWSAYFDEAEVKAAIEEIQAEVLALQSKLAAELDAEALAALAQAEDNVLAALSEQVDPETAKEIAPYAEKLLYAAVSYAVETAKALEAIHQINPDAEVILVGMYNPLAGTTVTVGGEAIDLGEIMEYAMEATDLYHLIYAVASGNVAFVDVSDTAVNGLGNLTVDDPKQLINSLGGTLMNAGAQISANAAGHAYIAEQIIGAIDFVGMLGDINLDGEVDTADAVAAVDAWLGKIELNELQKNNGDVNFDGTVDAADAALIVDFWLGKIQSFEK